MTNFEQERVEQNLQDDIEKEQRLREETEAAKKAKEALKDAKWLKPDWAKDEDEIVAEDAPEQEEESHEIEGELFHLPNERTVGWGIEDIHDKEAIAEQMAVMKQLVPEGAEIGVRLNPMDGKPEIYASGADLNFDDFEQKFEEKMGRKFDGERMLPTTIDGDEKLKTSLTPDEQKAFIENINEVIVMAEGMGSREANKDYVTNQKEPEAPAQEVPKTDLEGIKESLQTAGLQEIGIDEQVATTASKPQQMGDDFTPPH